MQFKTCVLKQNGFDANLNMPSPVKHDKCCTFTEWESNQKHPGLIKLADLFPQSGNT